MPGTAVGSCAIAATTTCHTAYNRPAAIPASAPTCRIVVVATLARRGRLWTCPRAWVSIAIPPIRSRLICYSIARPPRKAQDRERSRAVHDRAIDAGLSRRLRTPAYRTVRPRGGGGGNRFT